MGLFGKKKKEEINLDEGIPTLPQLSELPNLPELPKFPEFDMMLPKTNLPKLPKYPQTKFGEKFSQNIIKESIDGDEGDDEIETEDFFKEQMMPEFSKINKPENFNLKFPEEKDQKIIKKIKENFEGQKSPVFIRIDKFEESLKILKDTKEKIIQMEEFLKHIHLIKDKEEKELLEWDHGLQEMKNKLEKVERDLFSKI